METDNSLKQNDENNVKNEKVDIVDMITKTTNENKLTSLHSQVIRDTGAEFSIVSFLSRPLVVQSGLWSTTDSAFSTLFGLNLYNLLVGQPIWNDKLKGFDQISATVNLKFIINASPFQTGALWFYWNPIPVSGRNPGQGFHHLWNAHTGWSPSSYMAISTRPGVLYTTESNSVEMSIPMVNAVQSIQFTNSTRLDWGSVQCNVFSPLGVGAGGPTTAEITTWMWFTDVKLIAPVIPQMSGAIKISKRKRAKILNISEQETPPVSAMLSKAGKVTGLFKDVPFMSSLAGPATWALNTASQVAGIFGLSKPIVSNDYTRVIPGFHAFTTNFDGKDSSIPLGLEAGNKTCLCDQVLTPRQEDEMSIGFLKRQWGLLTTVNMTTTQTSGTVLYNQNIIPQDLVIFHTIGVVPVTYAEAVPLGYLARCFRMWRGSIEIKLVLVKTQYHSGTFSVTFAPTDAAQDMTVYNNTAYCHKEVFDIQDANEFCFTLPYTQTDLWRDKEQALGRMTLHVVNDLRCPESVNPLVAMLVYVRGGDDMDFAVPMIDSFPRPVSISAFPQMDYKVKAWPQGAITNDNENEACKEPIGNSEVAQLDTYFEELTIGESVRSLRQLCKTYSPIYFPSALSTNYYYMDPFNMGMVYYTLDVPSGNFLVSFAGIYGDYVSAFSGLYLYNRGSVRIRSITNPTVGVIKAAINVDRNNDAAYSAVGSLTSTTVASNTSQTGAPRYIAPVTAFTNQETAGFAIEYPMRNRFLGRANDPSGYLGNNSTLDISFVTTDVNDWTFRNYRAIGEDFQFCFFIGIPLLYFTN